MDVEIFPLVVTGRLIIHFQLIEQAEELAAALAAALAASKGHPSQNETEGVRMIFICIQDLSFNNDWWNFSFPSSKT